MPRIIDNAICIRHIDWSETSQIVVLLTENFGKIRGIAKGSKRTSPSAINRFSGGIELLTQGQVIARTKPTEAMAAITEWDLKNNYHAFRKKLNLHRIAMFGPDLANALLPDDAPHPNSYHNLVAFLDTLASLYSSNSNDTQNHITSATAIFQWLMLNDAGYRPNLIADVKTGEVLPDQETYNFDPIAGGLTLAPINEDWRVRKKTIATLRILDEITNKHSESETPIPQTFKHMHDILVGSDLSTLQRASRLLCVYIRALLDKQLPTMKFILE